LAFDSLKTQKEIHRADLFTDSAASSAKATDLSGISAGERLVDAPADRELAGKRIEAQP
jgi:hypothetical protein